MFEIIFEMFYGFDNFMFSFYYRNKKFMKLSIVKYKYIFLEYY